MRRGLTWSLVLFLLVAAGALGATVGLGHTPLLGLDLKGGVSVVLQPQGTANSQQLSEAVTIIERRVNGLGVSNSDVAVQGHDVVINLPGIKDSQSALKVLGTTAVLLFRPVYCVIPAYTPPTAATPKKSTTSTTTRPASSTTTIKGATSTTKAAVGSSVDAGLDSVALPGAGATTATTAATAATATTGATTATATPATTATTSPTSGSGTGAAAGAVSQADCSNSNAASLPTTPVSQDDRTKSVILPVDPKAYAQSPNIRYILGPADMTGSVVHDASAQIDTTTGQYSVALSLTSKGANAFDNIASARYACYKQNTANPPACASEAFELDGVVESAPNFQAASFNGNVQITGNFTSGQASNLANELKYGSLPVRFVPQSVQTVTATIGKDSLRAGLLAGIGGLIVVMLYMLVYYRALGLVVLAGICVGGALLYSIIAELGQSTHPYTLTLAGVTGVIVSIGITVDSYVVYFERLKDEVRAGRSVRQSTERSFSRAFRTVLTADLVSFMAALILYLLTIGDVRGFAFTLGLSTLLDVITAYLFIRPAVIFIGRRRAITDNRIFGIARGLAAPSTREA